MWVTMTRPRETGSTPARMSFWAGLPPQSTSTGGAPLSSNTMDVVSRSGPGTAPDVPRKTKRTGKSGRRVGSAEQERNADHGQPDPDEARQLGHAQRPQHQGVGAQGLGQEAADGVQAEIRQEERAGGPLQTLPEYGDEHDEDEKIPD